MHQLNINFRSISSSLIVWQDSMNMNDVQKMDEKRRMKEVEKIKK